jgi:hypothetical protein
MGSAIPSTPAVRGPVLKAVILENDGEFYRQDDRAVSAITGLSCNAHEAVIGCDRPLDTPVHISINMKFQMPYESASLKPCEALFRSNRAAFCNERPGGVAE